MLKRIFLYSIISITLAIVGYGVYCYHLPVIIPYTIEHTPAYASEYSLSSMRLDFKEKSYPRIFFDFNSEEKSKYQIPKYEIKNYSDDTRIDIEFYGVNLIEALPNYYEVMDNPYINDIKYQQVENNLVVTIYKKGANTPAKGEELETSLLVHLPPNDGTYPSFSKVDPPNDSIVYPATQKISFVINDKYGLDQVEVFFQEERKAVEPKIISDNEYLISFYQPLENNQHYQVKISAKNIYNKLSSWNWEFDALTPAKRVVLDDDRFEYLGWWGEINKDEIPVLQKPTTNSEIIGSFSTANRVKILSEISGESINGNNLWYEIDGGRYPGAFIFSEHVTAVAQPKPPTEFAIPKEVNPGEKWIDVNLTDKILTLFEYDKPVFCTYVSIGRSYTPTPPGANRVWYKIVSTRMSGGPPAIPYNYDLPNVPWTMFYKGSYALHGTYWHDKFGSQQSAGCTNLTQGDSKYLFENTAPFLTNDEKMVRTNSNHPGIVINNRY